MRLFAVPKNIAEFTDPGAAFCPTAHTFTCPARLPGVLPAPRFVRCIAIGIGVLMAQSAAHAADFKAIGTLSQAEFRAFSHDLSAAISYKGMVPAEALGVTGFDLSLAANATEVANRDVLRKAAGGGSIPSLLPSASLRAVKGLPLGLDIGLVATTLPGTNARAVGGELRWAFVEGGVVLPALAVRLATMQLSGVDQLKMSVNSIDLSISKGLTLLTPYAGIGFVDTRASAPGTTLGRERFGQTKVFAGVNIAWAPFALGLDLERTGSVTGYGAKLGLRW